MGRLVAEYLSDPSLPPLHSVRRLMCPFCFKSSIFIFFVKESESLISCAHCDVGFKFSEGAKRLFLSDKSKSLPVSCFVDVSSEAVELWKSKN